MDLTLFHVVSQVFNQHRQPGPEIVRKRIESVEDFDDYSCLVFLFLSACRISEAVSGIYPNDDTTNYGMTGGDISHDVFEGNQTTLFTIRTAKRKGRPRIIALPTSPEYEPWTQCLISKFKEVGYSDGVWPFPRQRINKVAQRIFDGLYYPIEDYRINKKMVEYHWNPLRPHGIRHVRLTELSNFYGFTGEEIAQYAGWKISSKTNLKMLDRYVKQNWQKYFPKLLKRRSKDE